MRRFALVLLCFTPVFAFAQDGWQRLDGAQIRVALTDRVLHYANATQDFRRSGKTLYTYKGRDSWGYWRIENDQYCSQWPPNDLWACYDLERRNEVLRFVGTSDDITEAVYAEPAAE